MKGGGFFAVLLILYVLSLFGGCSNSEEKQKETLNSGLHKYYSGEKMTKQEHDAVKSYHEWQDKQKTERNYDDWD